MFVFVMGLIHGVCPQHGDFRWSEPWLNFKNKTKKAPANSCSICSPVVKNVGDPIDIYLWNSQTQNSKTARSVRPLDSSVIRFSKGRMSTPNVRNSSWVPRRMAFNSAFLKMLLRTLIEEWIPLDLLWMVAFIISRRSHNDRRAWMHWVNNFVWALVSFFSMNPQFPCH